MGAQITQKFSKNVDKGVNVPLQRTVLSETNDPGHSWVQLVYLGWLYQHEPWGQDQSQVILNTVTWLFFQSCLVATKNSHPDSEMCKCLKTNTYFLVRKELSFFHYCSLNSNSQKGLDFKVHSEIACSINEEAMFSSVVTATDVLGSPVSLSLPAMCLLGKPLWTCSFVHY